MSDCLGGSTIDLQCDSEQTDSLNMAVVSTCEIGFEKVICISIVLCSNCTVTF